MKPALRLTNPHSATTHCEPVADGRALPPLPHIPTSYLQLKNLDKIHGMMRDYAHAALASAPVADNWRQYALPGETTAEQVCERMNAEVTRRTVAAMRVSARVAGEVVAWAAVPSRGKRAGRIYSTCDTRKEIDAYIELVHQSNDSLTLTPRPLSFADAAHQACAEPARILFPAHLRKMWSGGEVQAWLDEHQGVTPQPATVKGSLERYRQWKTDQAAPVCSCPSGDGSLRPCAVHSAQPTNDGGSNR